ncbi:MAG TPA: SIR2 family protein [Pyrinomonadaceae bacterium]|nr:SIR2 family protein [Pyrinomonadaceae bacterium]
MPEQAVPDYSFIKQQLETGRVIPFLGSAASLVGQSGSAKTPDDVLTAKGASVIEAKAAQNDNDQSSDLQQATSDSNVPTSAKQINPQGDEIFEFAQRHIPPSAAELARWLAHKTALPKDEVFDLATVAQYLKAVGGSGPLYIKLHEIFSRDYPATPLHEYLAAVAANVPLLVITTNYDDIIERAFQEVPHDVVVHICDPKLGDNVFLKHHRKVDGSWADSEPEKVIPNKLKKVDLAKTSVIYKMHGAVDKRKPDRDQYVIAEDDYIDFLTRMTKNTAIPAIFTEAFQSRHFLFLGYGLRDWNLRVILNRIQDNLGSSSDFTSWAIQYKPTLLESRFWIKRDVQLFDLDLMDFVQRLKAA